MSLRDCPNCWSYPCTCGSEFNQSFNEFHHDELLKKNTVDELLKWLESNGYLNAPREEIEFQYKNRVK